MPADERTPADAHGSGQDQGPRSAGRSSLVRSSSGISAIAAMGVVAGFVVDAVMAALFGAGRSTDAFFIAATIPFSLASVLLASANQALVPLISLWFRREQEAVATRRTAGLLGATLALGAAVAVAGMLLSPLLPRLIAPGAEEQTKELASRLSVLLFITVVTRSGAEVLRAALNARFSFIAPAAMPVVESASVLVVIILLAGRLGITAVALGFVAGGVLQLVFMVVMALRRGLRLRPRWGFGDPEVRRGFRLLGYPVGGTGLNMVARSAERFFVSFLPTGSITILNYAWVVVNSIGGAVFFRSVVVALLPRLSEVQGDRDQTRQVIGAGVRIMAFIALPLTALVATLAAPLVELAFLRGQFTPQSAELLASVLAVYALVFPLDALTRVLLSSFYARLDVRTPFLNVLLGVSLTIALAAALVPVIGVPGVAVAYVLATLGNLTHAYLAVTSRTPLEVGPLLVFLGKAGVSAAATAGVAFWVSTLMPSSTALVDRLLALGVPGVAGLAAFLVAMVTLRVGRVRDALTPGILRRGRGPGGTRGPRRGADG
jgi:putative peptidoglycan lipid II flippase